MYTYIFCTKNNTSSVRGQALRLFMVIQWERGGCATSIYVPMIQYLPLLPTVAAVLLAASLTNLTNYPAVK